ncbi:glyoxalase/bleomycin resistance/dioxygenase family protein [aff. Roholtiella sp. LEGE 12411]|uniref:glyoxalase/bleomycin resistance/dioxygenase family protein n=1 Tax=aff. Roholtiella sp. LEGE 12411 TaxID=1828822 RepID=UPI001FC86FE0|nr:glyoxalase/bleomycin resistance/dioxygenase family protein [aff. Roholtiella sp. LEGE 12411]
MIKNPLGFSHGSVNAYIRAIGAGAKGLDAPKKQPWGQTVARICDLNGVLVSLVSGYYHYVGIRNDAPTDARFSLRDAARTLSLR